MLEKSVWRFPARSEATVFERAADIVAPLASRSDFIGITRAFMGLRIRRCSEGRRVRW
jgi:hypothetical protein